MCQTRTAIFLLFLGTVVSTNLFAQDLVIQVNVVGNNVNQEATNSVLETSCAALANDTSAAALDLLNICQSIEALEQQDGNQNDPEINAQIQQQLESVAPEESFSINDSIVYVADYQTNNVRARINAIRNAPQRSVSATRAQGTATGSTLPSGGSAGDGYLISRSGFFSNANASSGDIDGGVLEQDTGFATGSFTLGADYRFSDALIAGVAGGILQNTTEFDRVEGSTELDGLNLTLFGSWYEQEKGYVDLVLDFGQNQYDLSRDISTTSARVLAQADTTATTGSLTISAGRNFRLGNWDTSGYFRLMRSRATVDGYTETASSDAPGFSSVFSVGSQRVESTQLTAGLDISRAVSTAYAVVVPSVRLEIEAETEKQKEDLQTTLLVSNVTSSFRATQRDTNYVNFGFGASAVFRGGINAFVRYETRLLHDFVAQNWLRMGLRYEL